MKKIKKNKKAWIRIVEAFTTILLIAGVLLVVLNRGTISIDTSQQVYDIEYAILREIQLNNSLRNSILGATIPSEFGDGIFPTDIENKIISGTPDFLVCEAKLCDINDACILDIEGNKNVFVQSIIITANLSTYSPRELKLFCWNS